MAYDDISNRDRIIHQEILDTLKHWQGLLLTGCEADLDAYLNAEGTVTLREDLAQAIVCGLTFVLHGYSFSPK
jgi:hypothetical protein